MTRIGAIEITPLSDGELHIPPAELLSRHPGPWPAGFLDADGLLGVNFGGFLLRTREHLVVVDTGIGGGAIPELPIGGFPQRLADAGVSPPEVDVVVFTHLHFDHVGWSTDGHTPFFPRAQHHAHAADWAWWCGPDPHPETGPGREEFGAIPAPQRLAPLAATIALHDGTRTEIVPGVTLRLAPGHSPGHCIVEVESAGERAVLLGDAAHSPAQLLADDWESATDVDPALAQCTRAGLAAELADGGALITMTHDAGNRFGRLVTVGGVRTWQRV
ncbi:MAG TPA: MBL fold metallo-hydrolase [Solirubrobacteraceae bacterium]|nr:MBL fold metallo-hydrolase [Solirubrobacteraceae bacterium]